MPVIVVNKKILLDKLNVNKEEELEDHLFNFGIEVDDVYEDNGELKYKLDIGANRYDLLCSEGLIRCLNAYINSIRYEDIVMMNSGIVVEQYLSDDRKYIGCAVIRNIKFDTYKYEDFIGFQEKLHMSIGRNRSIVSLGTHDLSKIKGTVKYGSVDVNYVKFRPLRSEIEVKGKELDEYFSKEKNIGKYFDLVKDKNRPALFFDDEGVISLPPVINSERTKISLDTKDIFVEVTGTNFNKVNTALKLILYNFRGESLEYVKIIKKNEILENVINKNDQLNNINNLYKNETLKNKEKVEKNINNCIKSLQNIFIENGSINDSEHIITPVFYNMKYEISHRYICNKLNINISLDDVKKILERMMHLVEVKEDILVVSVLDVRSDILHECDIIEDIAIGYGFNNLKKTVPSLFTIGCEDPLNKFADKIRNEVALMGFNEILSLTLLGMEENIINSEKQVILENPKSKDYAVVRTSLLPGLIKSIASNLHSRIPIKIFEVSDVLFTDPTVDEGARNQKNICICIAGNRSMLEEVQGPITFLLKKCGISDIKYSQIDKPYYLQNQAAEILIFGHFIGTIGVLNPEILRNFKIPYAASFAEINIEKVYEIFKNKIV